MNELARGTLACLFAMIASACIVSGTLGKYDAETSSSDGTEPTSESEPTDGPQVCSEGEPSPCASCLASSCCDTLPDCEGGADCACMFGCLTSGDPVAACIESCGAGAVATQFSVCAMKRCAPACAQP